MPILNAAPQMHEGSDDQFNIRKRFFEIKMILDVLVKLWQTG